jgi:hypothetical protein
MLAHVPHKALLAGASMFLSRLGKLGLVIQGIPCAMISNDLDPELQSSQEVR